MKKTFTLTFTILSIITAITFAATNRTYTMYPVFTIISFSSFDQHNIGRISTSCLFKYFHKTDSGEFSGIVYEGKSSQGLPFRITIPKVGLDAPKYNQMTQTNAKASFEVLNRPTPIKHDCNGFMVYRSTFAAFSARSCSNGAAAIWVEFAK